MSLLFMILIGLALFIALKHIYTRNPGLAREATHRIIDLIKWLGRTHIAEPVKELFK